MKYLLDTCVISEATKRKPDMNVVEWLGSVPISEQYISSVTLGEIQKESMALMMPILCDNGLSRGLQRLGGYILAA